MHLTLFFTCFYRFIALIYFTLLFFERASVHSKSSLDVSLFSVQCYHKVILLDGLLDSLREFEVLSIRHLFTSTPTLKLYKNVNFAR